MGQGTHVTIHLPPGPRDLTMDENKEELHVFASGDQQASKQ
jgi:hypothetical protein